MPRDTDGTAGTEPGPGCLDPQRSDEFPAGSEELDAVLGEIEGDQRVTREGVQGEHPAVFTGAVATSRRPPQEDALPVVAP